MGDCEGALSEGYSSNVTEKKIARVTIPTTFEEEPAIGDAEDSLVHATGAPCNNLTGLTTPNSTDLSSRQSTAERRERDAKAAASLSFRPVIICPLTNLGNTCYFNAGVQMLCNCPALVYGLRDAPHRSPAARTTLLLSRNSLASHTLFRAFAQLMYDMEFKQLQPREAVAPAAALEQLASVYCAFEGHRQQDCAEMVNTVLANLEDENRMDVEVDVVLHSLESTAARREERPILHGRVVSTSPACREVDEATCLLKESVGQLEDPRQVRRDEDGPLMKGLFGPHSASTMTMLRLMQQVNEENRSREQTERRRRLSLGKQVSSGEFRPPRLHYNATTDGFKGYTLSEIECHSCHSVSRVVDAFTSMMLDIPSPSQRRQYAKRHSGVVRRGPNGEPLPTKKKAAPLSWWNPLSYLFMMYQLLLNVFTETTECQLTLEECLDIHFEPAELKGNNKYMCQACGETSEATKKETLIALPEYLLIHMKRFKSGHFFTGKNNDAVIFPTSWNPLSEEEAASTSRLRGAERPEVLDLRAYVHPILAHELTAIPRALQNSSEPIVMPHTSGHLVSTYTLDGVVNHHGSLTGGHYTAFTRKQAGRDAWVLFNDDEIEEASLSEVADSEEYLLLYRKQPLVELHGEALQLRNKARYYLLPGPSASGRKSSVVYVSRPWLQRVALLSDPGPMMNRQCYCSPADRQRTVTHASLFHGQVAPHVHGPAVEWFYVPVEAEDYQEFLRAFGGDAGLSEEAYQNLKDAQARFIALVKRQQTTRR